jgi:MFS-type transporter involved in bile tolerance (Atg22 family)
MAALRAVMQGGGGGGGGDPQGRGLSWPALWAMAGGALMSVATGLSAWVSAPLAALSVVLWNAAIYLDSSALTAGTVQAAGPELRGATMGLHSMCGYAGGFVGPVGVGLALDLLGPDNPAAWALAFGHLALVTLAGLLLLRRVSAARR